MRAISSGLKENRKFARAPLINQRTPCGPFCRLLVTAFRRRPETRNVLPEHAFDVFVRDGGLAAQGPPSMVDLMSNNLVKMITGPNALLVPLGRLDC